MGIVFEGQTNIGQKRQVNEDSFWPTSTHHAHRSDDPYGMLFIVADGMGGHGAGDVASGLAVEEIPTTYYALGPDYQDIGDRLSLAIRQAHQRIRERATQAPELEDMGTTVAAAVVKYDQNREHGQVWVAWAGDSRVYLLRQGRLKQLTRDHSRVWPLIEAGQITWDELRFHPERSRITNGLTARLATVTPEVQPFDLEPGDLLLLCSDGLSGEVKPEEIEQILATYSLRRALPSLIDKANKSKEVYKGGQKVVLEGGNDNITAIVIQLPDRKLQPALAAPVPARLPRLGWIVGGVVVALVLVGAGLFLTLFDWGNSERNILTGVTTPAETGIAAPTPLDSGPTVVSVAVQDKSTATHLPEPGPAQATQSTAEARTPTVTRGPLSTPTLPATPTPIPTATATPLLTPTQLITAINPAAYPPPLLIEPKPYELDPTQHNAQEITFIWGWPGELTDELSFEIRVWLEGTNPQGVYDAKELKRNPTFVPLGEHQYAVTLQLTGPSVAVSSSDYLWSVGVVQVDPEYKWLDIESEPQRIGIVVSVE
jgi:protein phosphatase